MTTPSIDNVSDEVAKFLADIEKDKSKAKQTREANRQRVEQARPLLRQIWDELDANRPVKGCTTKQEWVEKFGKTTLRNCQYILKGGNKNRPERNVSPDIETHFSNVEFNAKEAYCVVDFEQKHEVKYQGKRRSSGDYSFTEDNNNATHEEYKALNKEDKIVWTHAVREVSGNIIITVENDGTMTEKQSVAALRTKMTGTLKSMRLWDKGLTKEFNALVKESADWHEEKKDRSSRAAQKGAAKTRKNKYGVEKQPASKSVATVIYTETCLTCGNQRTTDESNTVVTIPASPGAQNGARIHCQKCGTKALAYKWKKFADKPVGWQPPVTKSVDPAKGLMKRFRAAKRAAKFYCGMMDELGAVDGKSDKLLNLWSGKDGFPWTPPTKDYRLPKTETEFEAQRQKATDEFNKFLEEGKAAGMLTTAPREKKPALSEPAKALAAVVGTTEPQVTVVVKNKLKPLVEGEHGTKLHTEADGDDSECDDGEAL